MLRRGAKKKIGRVEALFVVMAMILSLLSSGFSSLGTVKAAGEKEVTVDGNGLSVSILVNGNEPEDPDIVYEGDQLNLSLSFNIPAGDLGSGITYVYDMPDNVIYSGADTTGSIDIPNTSPLYSNAQSAGTYTIDKENGKVYF